MASTTATASASRWPPAGGTGAPVSGLPATHGHAASWTTSANPRRILAADAVWSTIYNLSGDAIYYHSWNYPTLYDNTVAWRHSSERAANVLLQDGHVGRVVYHVAAVDPVSTSRSFLWYPGEPIHVGPEDRFGDNWYPNVPPIDLKGDFTGDLFPREMVPTYYTRYLLWTQIYHK